MCYADNHHKLLICTTKDNHTDRTSEKHSTDIGPKHLALLLRQKFTKRHNNFNSLIDA